MIKVLGNQQSNNVLDTQDHSLQFCIDRAKGKCLTLAEAYLENWLDACFVFRQSKRSAIRTISKDNIHSNDRTRCSSEQESTITGDIECRFKTFKDWYRELGNATDGKNKPMLIGYIKGMKTVKQFIPASIRLDLLNCFDDLFAGKLYMSILNGRVKACGLSAEGELNRFGLWSFTANHAENGNIKGCAQVMDGISYRKRKAFWDGFLGFDGIGALCSLWVIADPQFKRILSQIGINIPVQFVDVMFGPLDFEHRSGK